MNIIMNDDDAERREARRRTQFEVNTPSTTIEDSESLKNCLKICNENKLSKDNAWTVSVIDTLSALLSKHHKSLSNFKVAGSSLEASSRVYGLRVDSVHSEVVRMSSGLNKQKFIDDKEDDDDSGIQAESEQQSNNAGLDTEKQTPKRKKRARKHISTITKNKETINSRLDTNPFTDPIFAKLNTTIGSISSSNRLLQNILHSVSSELRLRMNYKFWDANDIDSPEYPEEHDYSELETVDALKINAIVGDGLLIRPHYSGYIITNTPAEQDEDDEPKDISMNKETNSQMAVAFDINAAVESTQPDAQTFIDVDMGDFEELTMEEQVAINKCKGLRRAPIVIEDMRPVDSTSSSLEYSYRPLDKISQFWAGPSHWKFKKSRNKSISLAQRLSTHQKTTEQQSKKTQNQRGKRKILKFRLEPLQFTEVHDDFFQKLDDNRKLRKTNVQKKWDAKKLKLPTDLQIDKNIFDVYQYAPGIPVFEEIEQAISPEIPINVGSNDIGSGDEINNDFADIGSDMGAQDHLMENYDNNDQTVVEIATDFEGAPDKVTKIIVPFAKRAKVVDMKQLKKSVLQIIEQQIIETQKENIPPPPLNAFKDEEYKNGYATFNKIYQILPNISSQNMNEALSTSVAVYSILHLANENNLRLLPEELLEDFQIRKIENV